MFAQPARKGVSGWKLTKRSNPPPASETKKSKKKTGSLHRPDSNRGSKEHSVDESIYGRNYQLNMHSNEYFDQNGTPIVDYGSGEYGLVNMNQQMLPKN